MGIVEIISMANIKELVILPQTEEYYGQFSRKNSNIKLDRIDLIVLCGQERDKLKTPVNGDSTLVLRYKEKEGVLLSLKTETERLEITQFQGSRERAAYRLNSEIHLAKLFADQIERVVNNMGANFERICMPQIEKIEGLLESDSAIVFGRYRSLALFLGMNYSNDEMLYIRDIKRSQITCLC